MKIRVLQPVNLGGGKSAEPGDVVDVPEAVAVTIISVKRGELFAAQSPGSKGQGQTTIEVREPVAETRDPAVATEGRKPKAEGRKPKAEGS